MRLDDTVCNCIKRQSLAVRHYPQGVLAYQSESDRITEKVKWWSPWPPRIIFKPLIPRDFFRPSPLQHISEPTILSRLFHFVRPAGRTHLEVEVLYSPGKGRRGYWIKIEARVVDASTDIPHGIRYSLTLL